MADKNRDSQPAPFGRLLDDQLSEAYHGFEAELSRTRSSDTVRITMQSIRQFCDYLRTGRVADRYEQTPWPND